MKKFVCVLFLLLMTVKLLAQNPFVKEMENCSDTYVKEIVEANRQWAYGTSNLEEYNDTFKNKISIKNSYGELNYNFDNEAQFTYNSYNIQTRSWGGVYFSTKFKYDFFNNKTLVVYQKDSTHIFKDFKLFYDDKYIYLRGYSGKHYIEFVYFLSLYKYSKIPYPNPVTKNDLIKCVDYVSYIKGFVQEKINIWQQKGEFEKMYDYSLRVTEVEIDNKIKELQEKAINELKDYLWVYLAIDSNFKINSYDSENETFNVNSE